MKKKSTSKSAVQFSAAIFPNAATTQKVCRSLDTWLMLQYQHDNTKTQPLQKHTVPYHAGLTWVVGFPLQHLQLSALGERVLQAQLQEAGLGPAHPLQQGQQGHRLLALIPALEPAG